MRVAKCPSNDLAKSNKAIVNSGDFSSDTIPHVAVSTGPGIDYVFSIQADPKVAPGTIAFPRAQRKWASLSTNEEVQVCPSILEPEKHGLNKLVLGVDFYWKKKTSTDPYNSDDMAREFCMQFRNQAFTEGQLGIFQFQDKELLKVVVLECGATSLSELQGEQPVNAYKTDLGILLPNTNIVFEKMESSSLNLTGKGIMSTSKSEKEKDGINEKGDPKAEEAFISAKETIEKWKSVKVSEEAFRSAKETLEKWKSVAVSLQSGSGKSSFINTIRGISDKKDENYAKIGVTETTTERKSYNFPYNTNIQIWYLPGPGTQSSKAAEYAKKMQFELDDTFVKIDKMVDDLLKKKIAEHLPELQKTALDEPITNFENFAVDPWRNTNNSLTKTFCIEDCANYIPRPSLFPAESNGIDELDLSLEISPGASECQDTSNQVSKKILSSSSKMDFLKKMILLLMFLIPFSTAQPIRMNHQFPPYHLKANNDKESILLPLDTNWDDVCELLLLIKIPSEEIGRTAFTAEHPKFGNGPLKFTIPLDGRSIWREQSFCFASCANVAKSPLLLSATSNMTLETNITIIPKIRKDACERITNPLSRPAVLGLIFVGTFFFTVILLLLVQRAKLAIKTLLNHDQTPKMDEFAIHSLLGQDQNPGKQ